jgi:hypothetical protein
MIEDKVLHQFAVFRGSVSIAISMASAVRIMTVLMRVLTSGKGTCGRC